MEEQELSQLIEKSLEAVLSGRASLEDILVQYPEQSETLRAELTIAEWLVSNKQQVGPRPGFVSASRKRVMTQIHQEAAQRGTKRAFFGLLWPRKIAFQWAVALLALILLVAGSSGLVAASQGALPGENLYPVKRLVEQAESSMEGDPIQRVELSVQYTGRRLMEAEALIYRGHYDIAETTLGDFEKEVQQSVVLLEQVSETKAVEKKQLAITLNEELGQQAQRIEELSQTVPVEVQEELKSAKDVSSRSAVTALQVADSIDENVLNPTATFMATNTFPLTETPAGKSTKNPTKRPSDVPARATSTPEPAATTNPTHAKPTSEGTPGNSGNDPKIENTPKPTNENRPVKPEKPTEETKPPKTEPPPQNEEPPKADPPPKNEEPPKADPPPKNEEPPKADPPKADPPPQSEEPPGGSGEAPGKNK